MAQSATTRNASHGVHAYAAARPGPTSPPRPATSAAAWARPKTASSAARSDTRPPRASSRSAKGGAPAVTSRRPSQGEAAAAARGWSRALRYAKRGAVGSSTTAHATWKTASRSRRAPDADAQAAAKSSASKASSRSMASTSP